MSADNPQLRGADEIVTERRLNTIYDIRDNIHELRQNFKMGLAANEISEFKFECGYRNLVDNYAMELQPLMLKCEPGKELLRNKDFGECYISPEIVNRGLNDDTVIRRPRRGDVKVSSHHSPEPTRIELEGLESLWDLPDPLTTTIAVRQFDAGTQGETTKEIVITDQIRARKLDEMTRSMNVFLKDVGLELDLEMDSEWEIQV